MEPQIIQKEDEFIDRQMKREFYWTPNDYNRNQEARNRILNMFINRVERRNEMQILIILLLIAYIPLGVIFQLAGIGGRGSRGRRRRRRRW